MGITFPKAKVGDKIRLTGKDWNKEEHGVTAGDIVTVTHLHEYKAYRGAPEFDDTINGGYWIVYTGSDEWDWGGELVTDEPPEVDPEHYKFPGGAEVIDISQWLTANAAQALQYIARSSRIDGKNKGNPREDLEKAKRFIDFELKRLEG